MRFLPWISLALYFLVVRLKLMYGNLHAAVAEITKQNLVTHKSHSSIVESQSDLAFLLILFAGISAAIGLISVQQKNCPSALRVVVLLLTIALVGIALIPI